MSVNKAKIAVSISEVHNDWLNEKSKDMGINKSALVSLCIDSYMKSDEFISSLSNRDVVTQLKKLTKAVDQVGLEKLM